MKATNFARASYQEVYDIMTKDGKVSIFGFHTPTGLAPYKMLSGFFRQFKKYRYSGMSASLIPAAQLPADPLQISYSAGTENYIDPRDLQNPILFHGAHGNNLGTALNRIYANQGKFAIGASGDLIEADKDTAVDNELIESSYLTKSTIEDWYYSAMLDPSFRKFNVMSNIKLPSMSPRVHTLATDMRMQSHMDPYGQLDIETVNDGSKTPNNRYRIYGFKASDNVISADNPSSVETNGGSIKDFVPFTFMSAKTTRLGWLDTFTFEHYNEQQSYVVQHPVISVLPKLFMGVLIMPPSYRTQLCFRMVLTHYFEFGGFNTAITASGFVPEDGFYKIDPKEQALVNYYNLLPDSLTEATAISDSVDAIDGEVKQTVSGVF